MAELKSLIEILKDAPNLIIWLVFFYFFFKSVVVGSVYASIRFVAQKLHDVLVSRRVKPVEVRPLLDGLCITGTENELMAQLKRLRSVDGVRPYNFIHQSCVDWLAEAIDDKFEKDKKEFE